MKTERQPRFLGHPVPLTTFSFAEMWERLSYCA